MLLDWMCRFLDWVQALPSRLIRRLAAEQIADLERKYLDVLSAFECAEKEMRLAREVAQNAIKERDALVLDSGESDLQKFYESLTHVKPGRGGYTRTDRYRDFRTTFNSDHGRRVLAQIIAHCEGGVITRQEVQNHADLSFRAGQRDPGLWIVHVLNAEPLEDKKTQ